MLDPTRRDEITVSDWTIIACPQCGCRKFDIVPHAGSILLLLRCKSCQHEWSQQC